MHNWGRGFEYLLRPFFIDNDPASLCPCVPASQRPLIKKTFNFHLSTFNFYYLCKIKNINHVNR